MNASRDITLECLWTATNKLFQLLSLTCFIAFSFGACQSSFGQIDQSTPLLYNTVITSIDFSGAGSLPLGPDGEYINTQVGGTKATDYNSSRSNKSLSIDISPDDPSLDDISLDEVDGITFDLFSTLDFEFDLSFTSTDPVGFAPELGDLPTAETTSNATLELEPGAVFVFERSAPDYNMLRSSGPPKKKHEFRGHVTVLKIAFGGGGGGIDVAADGMSLFFEPGTDQYTHLANGEVRHSVDFTLDIMGTYSNPSTPNAIVVAQPFALTGLTGTLIEEGQLVNNLIVPEPSAMLLTLAGLTLTTLKRRS